MIPQDTIIALATPPGTSAISVLRISGADAMTICDSCFESANGRKLVAQKSHTIHLGNIKNDHHIIDKVLVSIFKAPRSYTGENSVEISCHGSIYIQQEILQLFLRNGCRMADPGEFTLRAFLNGKLDLSEAEAVADLISSNSKASHQVAMQQMRGGFSSDIEALRAELLHVASLIELELDFAEEDVEFADRNAFEILLRKIHHTVTQLVDSFATGAVIKNGVPVAIAGKPNVGKSTLLNTLLHEERAIVSEIPGTTRDTIEDEVTIGGIRFRFIDTAGIRDTEDTVERIGIRKTFEKIKQARVLLYLFDAAAVWHSSTEIVNTLPDAIALHVDALKKKFPNKPLLIIGNKIDQFSETENAPHENNPASNHITQAAFLLVSAKEKQGIDTLKSQLLSSINTGALPHDATVVTNVRHYQALLHVQDAIQEVQQGLNDNRSGDLLAIDIRRALHHLGMITGSVTTDDLLGNIFSNFCIGK